MDNGSKPAFARANVPDGCDSQIGLTKREYFAATAVRGLLGTQAYGTITPQEAATIAENAIKVAAAILTALNSQTIGNG